MQFAIMQWVSEFAKPTSMFGVLDKGNPGKLPMLSTKGHWADYRTVDERSFKFSAEAKTAINATGYYLMGAGVAVTEAFGDPPQL